MQTLPESRTNDSLTLVLIAKVRRSKLPFTWLDSAPSSTNVPARLIFHAELPITSQSHSVEGEEDVVWVGRQAPNGRLYAVESLAGNMHVGCLLADWVKEEEITAQRGNLSNKALVERLLSSQQASVDGENSSRPTSQHGITTEPFRTSPKKPKNRRGALARMSIMPSKETTPTSCSVVPPHVEQQQRPLGLDASQSTVDENSAGRIMHTSLSMPAKAINLTSGKDQNSILQPLQHESENSVQQDPVNEAPPSARTILETLHRQYLETLYASKTSLAYFAKGPLVRARTQMQSSPAFHVSDLANFCRDSIVPTKKMDLKYRESIGNTLQSVALLGASNSGEQVQKASKKPKTKQTSSKPRKLGKDGLYPTEKEFVVSWWNGRPLRESDFPTDESRTREMKTAIADLRSRETEMQLLLVLEALALEAAETASVSEAASKPLIKEEPPESGQGVIRTELPRFKKRNRQDLKCELELLVDRLCIWHTIGFEDASNPSEGNQGVETGQEFHSKDRLRDFCSDVIIPFYSTRLPEPCKAICQKLGGPLISPNRPRKTLQKSLSFSRVLPGAAVKVPHGSISKRTLQRVLSEDHSSRHVSPPILSRSSTTSLVPNLKREPTEPLQRPESRGGLQKSKSFANREIDLVKDARNQNVKQKKLTNLAKQKQEMDAAINALRKPNRGLAAKEIADEIERHRLEGANLTKRRGLGIEVNATPRKSKQNDAGQGSAVQSGIPASGPRQDAPLIELSVPSSTMRPATVNHANDWARMSTVGCAVARAADSTPVRNAWKRPNQIFMAKQIQEFDIFTGDRDNCGKPTEGESDGASLIQATPAANRLRSDMLTSVQNTPLRTKKSQRPVLFTPMRKADITIDEVFKDAPEIPEQAGKAMARVMGGGSEMSIYDSLGWNDDFDD